MQQLNITLFNRQINITLLSGFLYSPIFGQIDSVTNYNEFITDFYFKNISNLNDTVKKSGYIKEFERMNMIWSPRLYPHGNASIAANAWHEYTLNFINNNRNSNSQTLQTDWECKGPFVDNSTNNKYTGQMHRITFDPGYDGVVNRTIYACSSFGGLWRSEDGGNNWEIVNTDEQIPYCGVADVAINYYDPNVIYIGTGYADAAIIQGYGANESYINPIQTQGIYRSKNRGQSWEIMDEFFLAHFQNGGTIRKIAANPFNTNEVIVATTKGVFRCSNSLADYPNATIWNTTNLVEDIRGLEYHKTDNNVIYASGTDIYKSTNGGSTWSSITGLGTGLDIITLLNTFSVERINIATTTANSNILYAYIQGTVEKWTNFGFRETKTMYLYQYNDISETWIQIHYKETPWCNFSDSPNPFEQISQTWLAIAASPINSNDVCFGYTIVERNSNISDPTSVFSDLSIYAISTSYPIHPDVHDLEYEPNVSSPRLFATHHGGISYYDFNSNQWHSVSSGLVVNTIWAGDNSKYTEDFYVVGCQDNGIYYLDGNWRNETNGDGYGAQVVYDAREIDEIISFVKGNSSLYRMMNNSGSWSFSGENNYLPLDPIQTQSCQSMSNTFKVVFDPKTKNPVFTANELISRLSITSANPLWQVESDFSATISEQWKRQITELAISKSNPDYIYAAIGGVDNKPANQWDNIPKLFRSTTGLSQGDVLNSYFEDITANLPQTTLASHVYPIITGIAISPTDPLKVWVSFTGYDEDIKVWKSTTGGNSWENDDLNHQLENLPVNAILYQEGTKDRIYIGTDIGVYFKEENSDWIKLSGIPNVRVTELNINPCSGKLVAYTFGRGIWECTLLPEDNYNNVSERIINSDENWSNDESCNSNIRIESSNTLSIAASLYMGANRKIIVESGATLIVDGGIITNQCNALWQGIELQGKSDQSQLTPSAQGQVILKNNAVIENAREGITTIANSEDMNAWDWNTTGGIVKVSNSTFRNCRRAIQFLPYDNFHPSNPSWERPNLSYIKNCTFETTDNLANGEVPYAFITLYEVDGIRMMGNTFQNAFANADPFNLGNGIISQDAKYYVTAFCNSGTFPCTSLDKNEFINLEYGIRATATSDMKPITVTDAVFNMCHYGVYISTIDYASVVDNEFIVSSWIDWRTKIPKYSYGLYFNQSKHFEAEGNYFKSSTNPSERGWTGMYVNNSGIGNLHVSNEVYRNTFEDLYTGIIALNNNGGGNLQEDGLTFHCDTFLLNTYDIAVLPQPFYYPIISPRISEIQGVYFGDEPELLVRNIYSADCSPNDENQFKIDYYNNSGEYILHASYDDPGYQPLCYDSHLQLLDAYLDPLQTDCPSSYNNNPLEIKENLLQLSIKKNEIDNLIDGGQTNTLIAIAQSNMPHGQILQTMIEFSPYLSDEVLLTLIDRSNPLPPGAMQQILIANSSLSSEVYTVVQNMHPSLPGGIFNQVATLQTNEMSERDYVPVISSAFTQKERILEADLIRYYLNDTLSVQPLDSVKMILNESNVKESKLNLVSAYIETKHFNKATMLIDSLQMIDDSLKTYADKQALSIQAATMPGINYALVNDSVLFQELTIQSNDTINYGSLYAYNILEWFSDSIFEELTLIPMPGINNKSLMDNPVFFTSDISYGSLKCYPNPATERFTAEYELYASSDNSYLVIYDVKGQEIQRVKLRNCEDRIELATPNSSGTYYVFLEDCGRSIAVDKIVVIK